MNKKFYNVWTTHFARWTHAGINGNGDLELRVQDVVNPVKLSLTRARLLLKKVTEYQKNNKASLCLANTVFKIRRVKTKK
jgi:hypothetical protein